MEKVKLGIIGCGLAAKKLHYPALKEITDKFEVVAVSNHTEPKAKELASILGNVPYYLDYRELLKRKDIEAVDIALPINLNYQVTKDSLGAGKHVFLEKPLAANLEDAEEMLKFPAQYDKVMLLAENFRYKKIYYRIKDLIKDDIIGKPYSVIWNNFAHVDDRNVYARTDWRKHHQYEGGFITDGGVHSVAALRFIFGNITPVSSFIQSVNKDIGTVDTLNLQMKFNDDLSGSLFLYFSSKNFNENRMIVFGSKGTLIADDKIITIKNADEKEYKEDVNGGDGFKEEFLDFYSAIREGKKVLSSFDEGYQDLKTILDSLSNNKMEN